MLLSQVAVNRKNFNQSASRISCSGVHPTRAVRGWDGKIRSAEMSLLFFPSLLFLFVIPKGNLLLLLCLSFPQETCLSGAILLAGGTTYTYDADDMITPAAA